MQRVSCVWDSILQSWVYYHHWLNNISYSKDLQSQSSQSLPPASKSPKEEMQPTRNEKSLSIISICWHMTVPWHFNFCNKQLLKRQLNIFVFNSFDTRQDERERDSQRYTWGKWFLMHTFQKQNRDDQLAQLLPLLPPYHWVQCFYDSHPSPNKMMMLPSCCCNKLHFKCFNLQKCALRKHIFLAQSGF